MPSRCRDAGLIVLLLSAAALAGCKPENKFVAPPPPDVNVAPPLQQSVRPFVELTGNTVAIATVGLVARVEGFLQSIDYKDGAVVKKGDPLFLIEPTTYQAKVKQAEAELDSTKALLVQAQAEFVRQETLLRQNVTAQNTYDQAKAKRDSIQANIENNAANLTIAQTNLGYTKVQAPFDGIVTNHLVSVGELVGSSAPTKLASIIQLDPIYATFNMSEQQVLDIRTKLRAANINPEDLRKIPIEIGLMTEQGYPHKGTLDYASPSVDASTGTIMVRAIFDNPNRALLPGFFVRVRVPTDFADKTMLIVPDRVVAEDQAGRYVLVVGKDDMVEQRPVIAGILLPGGLRVIDSGLKADDRVVVSTNGRAIPGRKVAPKATTIQAAPAPAPAK
ncbi:MAG: efflux RND transporter periplasmic adaptor subunit [Alphaproteobacteria bacterium]|nr:MAG: efflux RND transporter periplasmic adaptor subunit [Alphaproteobacteria bacterium]